MPSRARILRTLAALAVLLPIAAALAPLPAAAQSGRGTLRGFVVDESGAKVVPGAHVTVTPAPANARLKGRALETTTDATGEYSLAEVPYGRWILRVTAPGFMAYEAKFYEISDAPTVLHVQLDRAR